MSEVKSGIYCIENKINHKKYIGQSKNIADRWRRHIGELNKNSHDNDYLQKSWNKNGEENFDFQVLEYCDINELDLKESYYINLYQTLNRNFGYNLKSGGQNGGSKLSQESKEKLSNSIKESYTQELIEKRKQDALSQWANQEIRNKMIGENNGMFGKHHSEESINKIKAKRKNVKKKKQIRKVLCVELNKIYKNASDAAKNFGMKTSANILNVCYGKRQTAGGYHWKFIEE